MLSNERGMTLLEVTIVAGVAGMIALGLASTMVELGKIQHKINTTYALQSLRHELSSVIQNEDAWKKTVADEANSTLRCVRDGSDCSRYFNQPESQRPALEKMLDAAGQVLHLRSQPNSGYSTQGQPCQTFDATQGNDLCPFRYEYSWEPINCTASNCINSDVMIHGTLIFRPSKSIPLNPANYRVQAIHKGIRPPGRWPDLIICSSGGGSTQKFHFYLSYENYRSTTRYVASLGGRTDTGMGIEFRTNGRWRRGPVSYGPSTWIRDCTGKSIDQLVADGQAKFMED